MIYFSIALCGVVGVVLRHIIIVSYASYQFPWGTLIVNGVGSLFIGLYYGQQTSGHPWFPPLVHSGLTIGFLGALTTYSTFSLDTIKFLQAGELVMAGANVLLNTGLSLFACYLGIRLIALVS